MPDLASDVRTLYASVTSWTWPPAVVANHDAYPSVAALDEQSLSRNRRIAYELMTAALDAPNEREGRELLERARNVWSRFVGQWGEVLEQRETERRARRDPLERLVDAAGEGLDELAAAARKAAEEARRGLMLAALAVGVLYVMKDRR